MSRRSRSFELPSWIFDVEDEDDVLSDVPMLSELEIDLGNIRRNIIVIISRPWISMTQSGNTVSHEQFNDVVGPCIIVSMFCALLWILSVQQVPWVFVIWFMAAFFLHLIARVFMINSSLTLHLTILGYSVLPLIPLTLVVAFLQPPSWLALLSDWIGVIWSTMSTFLIYDDICSVILLNHIEEKRRFLLIPPILLMELYLISLMPSRRK